MPRDPAPVALFAYRRPDHLQRTIDSLASCPEVADTRLYVFADGAKGASDAEDVAAVRAVIAGITGFAAVTHIERPVNLGLAGNVISGVTQVLAENERVIVVEDDMVVSQDFLGYMNQALDMYADDQQVASIHGYVYATPEPLPDYFFLRGADCWGWATWRRGWALFEPDGQRLLDRLEAAGSIREFDIDGAFPYGDMLRDQIAGRNDSWAVRWYASAFLAGALTLYPGRSLVANIGLDGSGTHSGDLPALVTTAGRMPPMARIPIEESRQARAAIADALRPASRSQRVLGRLRRGGRA
jgi:hypothetical protein